MNDSALNEANKNTCLHCGHPNPLWAESCEKCYKKLIPPDGVDFSRFKIKHSRPGCITYYAGSLLFQGILGILGGIIFTYLLIFNGEYSSAMISQMGLSSLGSLGILGIPLVIGISLFSTGLNFLLGWGLWTLKNWARILIIILHSLSLGSILITSIWMMFNAASQGTSILMMTLIICLLFLAMPGIVIAWFYINADYFN